MSSLDHQKPSSSLLRGLEDNQQDQGSYPAAQMQHGKHESKNRHLRTSNGIDKGTMTQHDIRKNVNTDGTFGLSDSGLDWNKERILELMMRTLEDTKEVDFLELGPLSTF